VKKNLKKNYFLEQTDSAFEDIYGSIRNLLLNQNSPDDKYDEDEENQSSFSSSKIVDIVRNSNYVLRTKSVPRLPSCKYPGFGYIFNDNGIFFFTYLLFNFEGQIISNLNDVEENEEILKSLTLSKPKISPVGGGLIIFISY
jgi:hypothetical protein